MFYYEGIRGVDELLKYVLENGVDIIEPRTGHTTRTIFDGKIVLPNGFEFVTNRLASPRLAFEEMMFFLRGQTDTSILEEKGVYFWSGNTTRKFLDNRGLQHLPEKSIGAAYSKQWRNRGNGIDQLKNLIDGLTNTPYARRHIIDLWNPDEEPEMPLTPCHLMSIYTVLPNENGRDTLHVKLINRSLDTTFGAIFAIMQYSMFQMMLANMLDMDVGKLSLDLSNIHIYDNQMDYVRELVEREYPKEPSSLTLKKKIKDMDDLLSTEWEDFDMIYHYNKTPFKNKRPEMVA